MNQERKIKVYVWGKPYEISVHQKLKTVWIAVGEYMGEPIEVSGGALVLPDAALDIIRAQKRIGANPYVFAGRGDGHFKGFSPCKRAFDEKVTKALDGKVLDRWTVHDLRRTARSLMARAGVRSEIAERVMGHVLPGVEGIYDRHEYREEKADALAKLAGLIALILDPPAENVTPLRAEV